MAAGPDEYGTLSKLLAGAATLATALGLGPVLKSWLKRRKTDPLPLPAPPSDSKVEALLLEQVEELEQRSAHSEKRREETVQNLIAALQDVAALRERLDSAQKEINRLTGELGRILAELSATKAENIALHDHIHSIRHGEQLATLREAIRKAQDENRPGS